MRKIAITVSLAALVVAGVGFAAAGGLRSLGSDSMVLLPAGSGGVSAPSALRATPGVVDAAYAGDDVTQRIKDSYICVFARGAVGRGSEASEAARAANAGGGKVDHVYGFAIQGFSLHISSNGLQQMRAHNPKIAYCEADQIATIIDPIDALARPGGGGGTTQPAQSIPAGITRVNGGTTASNGTAWVIDTGIDLDHPDLNVDLARSQNFVTRETSPDDLNGHGSHVSGTIAAKLNTIGVVGVAPGSTLVAVRVLDRRGSGAYSDVIAGVDYVAKNGIAGDVANMSLGGPVSQALDDAVVGASSKVKFALAAGNETDNANNHSPARANGPNIYTVSAIDKTDTFASFSNYGNPPVDYAEPGVSILSTWKDAGYNTISGTSMATPHMAGVLLLGGVRSGGTAKNDPDGKPDTIGIH
ncbi:S8 family serine peptidase [Novosphingobium tardum]|uniref:S8 family serine peptidase n=1 Tax=Novosphingobium tardum TaxID=1538021 RepID=A0ABV8RS64_9SPHN